MVTERLGWVARTSRGAGETAKEAALRAAEELGWTVEGVQCKEPEGAYFRARNAAGEFMLIDVVERKHGKGKEAVDSGGTGGDLS